MKVVAEQDCDACHGRIAEPMTGVTADDCLGCHAAEIIQSSQKIKFPHEKHIASGFGCEFCHGNFAEMPHLEFARSPGASAKPGHEFCGTCHVADVLSPDGTFPEEADCTKCHLEF
jgi:hypothetical protein